MWHLFPKVLIYLFAPFSFPIRMTVLRTSYLQSQSSLLDFIGVLLPLCDNASNYGIWRNIKYIFSVNSSCHRRRDTFWSWYLLTSTRVVSWISQAELNEPVHSLYISYTIRYSTSGKSSQYSFQILFSLGHPRQKY